MATPTAQQINAALRGFDRLYGLELLDYSEAEVRARVRVRDELKQPAGLVHGGLFAAVAESLASLATALAVLGEGNSAVGLSNNTSFLRPMAAGRVDVTAWPIQQGRTQQLWQVEIVDQAGRLIATGQLRVANVALAGADATGDTGAA